MLLSKDLPRFFLRRFFLGACCQLSTAAAIASKKSSAAGAATEPHFLVGYLADSCGFSKKKAAEVSRPVLSRVKSAENPSAVLAFLREQGFSKDQIRKVVSADPSVLYASVQEALEPKIRALKDAEFSKLDIPVLFSTKPRAFRAADFPAKVRFWATVFDTKEALLKAILTNQYIIFSSLDDKMKPNVRLLLECLRSEDRIKKVITRKPQLLTANTDALKKVIKRIESFGVSRDSMIFDKILRVLIENSVDNFDAKFELLKSFGWTETEFVLAIRRNPAFLSCSTKKIRSMMEFLMVEVGFDPSYVAAHPSILTFSLEGRMKPRHCVLGTLKSNGLIGEGYDFYRALLLSEKKFLKKFIIPSGEKAMELYLHHIADCCKGKPN